MLQIYNFWVRNQERTKHNFGATVDIYVYVKIGRAQLPDTSFSPFKRVDWKSTKRAQFLSSRLGCP